MARDVASDFHRADLPPRSRSMLELAVKLTREPWLVGEGDRDALRKAGLSSREILHLVLGCAVFNYFNRMADGLGIPLDYEGPVSESVVLRGEEPPAAPSTVEPQAATDPSSGVEPGGVFARMAENPVARDRALEWRSYLLEGTPELDGRARAKIAERVSAWNRCEPSRRGFAGVMGAETGVDGKLEALLEHAWRLTREPWTIAKRDIEALRRLGLDDLGILRLTMLVSYVSFENRVVQGLGS